ncbi:MAG: phosphopantetheine-binding protein [Bacteroidales bacterium]|nr:phosphopantetheine-binding protein [Bacteroidales bacterium]
MTNVIEELKVALAEEFEVEIDDIQPDSDLVAVLDLDSLDMVDIVVLVESVTGVKLAKTDFKGITTFGEFFSLIESRKA